MSRPGGHRNAPTRVAPRRRQGLGAIDAERFDVAAAVGGWQGVVESVAPTLVFVSVLVVRPRDLVVALVASLSISAVGLIARLVARQPLTQVISGAVLALISAAWAWRTGEASNFYVFGLVVNAVWLAVTAGSLAVRWPLVGVLLEVWRYTAQDERPGEPEDTPPDSRAGPDGDDKAPMFAWRTAPGSAETRRRYTLATAVLSSAFALRVVVEVPLYLLGEPALGALGVARLVLGVPLYALTLWIVWRIARPQPDRASVWAPDYGAEEAGSSTEEKISGISASPASPCLAVRKMSSSPRSKRSSRPGRMGR